MPRADRPRRYAALILAAGRGWRMGGPKALMQVTGRPWWQHQADRLAASGIDALWVVSSDVFGAMGAAPPRAVIADADAPMFESIRTGVAALQAGPVDGVFVHPVDVPVPRKEVWQAVAASGAPAAPVHQGLHGHPVFLPWLWAESNVLRAPASARLDELLRDQISYIDVEDAAAITNLNTPAELAAWLEARGPG